MSSTNPTKPEFGNKIGQIVYDFYSSLPKNGKCQEHEWTVLSAILLEDKDHNYSVVSLGTGTKCLSSNKLNPNGVLVNDCHAEIVTRRNFIVYLLREVEKSMNGDSTSIFEYNNEKKKYGLKSENHFHMYISQSPCGEACIFDEINAKEKAKVLYESKKRNKLRKKENCILSNTPSDPEVYSLSIVENENTHLTGAKRIITESLDEDQKDKIALRIKPGRGTSTLSNCCSDKLSLYCVLGIQGALLSCLIEPIYLDSIVISCYYDQIALDRCFQKRFESLQGNYSLHIPKLYSCSLSPSFCQESVIQHLNGTKKLSACGFSISWNKYTSEEVLISVNGIRNGTSMKKLQSNKNIPTICCKQIFSFFLECIQHHPSIYDSLFSKNQNKTISYKDIKQLDTEYNRLKNDLLNKNNQSPFYGWNRKDQETYYSF